MLPGEDAFLPTDDDRIKARIKKLQVRLKVATEKRKQLRRELIEEDLSHVVVSRLTDMIKDPTRANADQLDEMQKKILDQLVRVAEQCTSKEIFSYYRLAGCSVFDFQDTLQVITLETFYNKMYRDSFKICLMKRAPMDIFQHSIPPFIPVEELAKEFLPHDLQTFLRIIHDAVQAFVTRREMFKDLATLFKVVDLNVSVTHAVVEVELATGGTLQLTFQYDYISARPTDINIRDLFHPAPICLTDEELDDLHQALMLDDIQRVLTLYRTERHIPSSI